MTYGQGQGQQDQSWEQRRYDLRGHTERLRRLQTPPQGQPSPQEPPWQEPPWQQPGYGQQQRYVPPQPGYVTPQQQPRYAPPQPPAPEPLPPPAQNRTWKIFAGIGGFVIVILAFSIAANRAAAHTASITNYRDSSATVAATPAAASSAASSPSAGRVIAAFTGSGTENTAKFAVTATWKLDYTFDCSNFGGQGNFQIYEDGGSDTSLTVNALATRDTASTYAYHDAGTHYLEINSECSWTVKVIDEGS